MLSLGIATALIAAPPAVVHATPAGEGPGNGTAEAPFVGLETTRDAVRAMKAAGKLPGGVTVLLHGGDYRRATSFHLTAEDSGTAAAPVVYRAAPGEEVRLTGALPVPADAFTLVTDPVVRERLPEAVRDRVVQADLKALGLPPVAPMPAQFRGAPLAPELFYNDRRMTLARWPNEGWAHIAKILETGSVPRTGDQGGQPGSFQYDGDRPARWDVAAGVWLRGYWCFDWYEETIQVQAIDPATHSITFARPHLYGVKQGNPSPRRYCALNLLEELDSPGEFYLDRAAHRLYFLPPGPLAGARVELSLLDAPVVTLTDCRQVVLNGLIVEAGLTCGVEVTGGEECRIEACRARNLRQLGIRVVGGRRHQVLACDIHDTGTGGLHLEGGDRKTLTPAGHQAINNHIWGFARHQLTYANGLMLAGVGNRAAHNLLHDAPHQAAAISGNDHLFELNEVHHVCLETDDCGALYKGRNPSMRGNVIRHNFWHHLGGPMGHGNAAIYFDDGDGGEQVIGNVFFRCGDPGRGSFGTVFSHGGHDNLAEHNVFVECRRAIGSAPWNDQRWRQALAGGDWVNKLRREVDISQPPYTTRYPALVGYLDPPAGQARVNHAARNLFAMCGEVSSGNWRWSADENLVTAEDPGFVDAARGDFRLRPDAPALTAVPGFEPPPFEQMGLVADALRPEPPAREWPYDPPQPLPPPERRGAPAR